MGRRFVNSVRERLARYRSRKRVPSVGLLGLEFSLERLNLVQIESGPGGLGVRGAACVSYPADRESLFASPAQLRLLVREALQSGPFRGNRVVTCLPASDAKMVHLNYEMRPGQVESDVVGKALQERLGADLTGWVMDYIQVRSDEQNAERSALAVAAPREKVIAHLELLRRAGLEAEALEVGPVAIRRLVASIPKEGNHPNVLVINVGAEQSYANAVWGRRLMSNREIGMGENQLVRRLSEHLEVAPAQARRLVQEWGVYCRPEDRRREEHALVATLMEILRPSFLTLVEEVTKALVYLASVTRGGSAERVYLLGALARWPGADRFLEEVLGLPVEVPDPFEAFPGSRPTPPLERVKPVVGLVLAAGCALRGFADLG
ncbi:MAG: pilus assembly protein PilM [Deltaproteobacteria bacterium]|nr:pilus assembly protein PilM [Deltaproteobacteria bacterium]